MSDQPTIREKLLQGISLKRAPIDIPEWRERLGGQKIYVREMTGLEDDNYSREVRGMRDEAGNLPAGNYTSRIVCRCLVDEKGVRIFNDDDVDNLGHESAVILEFIYQEMQKLNKNTKEARKETEKN